MTGENIKSILGDNASRLQELIIDWIRRGEFKIGSKLPSQNELVKIFSCSETTVHKAMQSLCKKGIIYRQIGKGTFLRQLPPKTESSSRIPYADFPIELNAKTCNKKLNILVFSVLDKKEPPLDSPAYEILAETEGEIKRLAPFSRVSIKGISNLELLKNEIDKFAPDGVIIDWTTTSGQLKPLAAELILRTKSIPLIHCMHSCDNENSLKRVVSIDNCGISRLALEYLSRNGHKNIMLANSFSGYAFENIRLKSAFDVAEVFGIKLVLPDNLFKDYPKTTDFFLAGKNNFDFFQLSKKDITAVYATNDKIAISFIKEAQKRGIRIPEDLSVIGVDNEINLYFNNNINLTSIDPCRSEVGIFAAKWLFEILLGFNNDINSLIYRVSPRIIERDTVKVLRI